MTQLTPIPEVERAWMFQLLLLTQVVIPAMYCSDIHGCAESGQLPTGLEIQALDADTAFSQLRVVGGANT